MSAARSTRVGPDTVTIVLLAYAAPSGMDVVITYLPPGAQKLREGHRGGAVSLPGPHPSPRGWEATGEWEGEEDRYLWLEPSMCGRRVGQGPGQAWGLSQTILLGMGQPSWGSRRALGQNLLKEEIPE